MAANELGRARISMMVRSMSSNTRPDTLVQDRKLQPPISLATHGGSIQWVSCDRQGGSYTPTHVRFAPKADKRADVSLSPLYVTSGREQT